MYKFYSTVGLFNICKKSSLRSITVPKSKIVYSFLIYLKIKGYLHCFMDLGNLYRIVPNSRSSNFCFSSYSTPSNKIYFTYKEILSHNRRGFNFLFSTTYGVVDSEFCLDKKIGGKPLLRIFY
jgi:ribosomal protein S8